MQPVAGYLVHYKDGIQGERGIGYDYIIAGNGVFIQADNDLLFARVPVADCNIRGLGQENPEVVLKHGKIPVTLFALAFDASMAVMEKEIYLAITWDNGYHLFKTGQDPHEANVKYDVVKNTVMDFHSHGKIPAFFSGQDNADEQGFRLSCVVGSLDKQPMVCVRIGVYGSFLILPWKDVFDGVLIGVKDVLEITEEDIREIPTETKSFEIDFSGMWWNRLPGG
ncbi:MAG: Mov34/MPN/PAD-1 family protein [Dehalococcoidales bacterium]|nr:Mov34/MPN/PAD-1 family protein [Candidatus Omnitrophota bacterium]MDD5511524.1 Mov34/MPN/PAD-1 family protein [Dehalococcoidales bacterium]